MFGHGAIMQFKWKTENSVLKEIKFPEETYILSATIIIFIRKFENWGLLAKNLLLFYLYGSLLDKCDIRFLKSYE